MMGLVEGNIKAGLLLRRREDGGEPLSPFLIAGIVLGAVAFLLLLYVLYRYVTWVPRTRAKSPTRRGSSEEESKRLFAAIKTKA